MSIIIIGVGGHNFVEMDALDSDGALLRSGSQVALRDVVQFVPMRDYLGKPQSALSAVSGRGCTCLICDITRHRRCLPSCPGRWWTTTARPVSRRRVHFELMKFPKVLFAPSFHVV